MNFTCIEVATAGGLKFGRKVGADQLVLCPGHDDHDPSNRIDTDKDLWFCDPCGKGGTPWQLAALVARVDASDKSGVQRWLAEHGLSNGNGIHRKPAGLPSTWRKHKIACWYTYTDEHGKPLFYVARVEFEKDGERKKEFPVFANGTWGLRGKDIRSVVYRLATLKSAKYIWIVEGEKDVDALNAAGFVATCNPGGAGKFLDAHAAFFKADQHIVIIPDNDQPGYDHAALIAPSLHGKVASLKVLTLAGLPPKGDVSDWLKDRDLIDAGEELSRLAEQASEWMRETAPAAAAFAVPEHWRWLDVATRRDWNCAPLRWTVDDLIAQGNFIIVAAETQTGKTLFGLFLSHSILREGKLFGRLSITPVDKILYMGLEDPDRRFSERLGDIEHAFPPIEPGRFIVHTAPDFTLTDERMVQYLERLILSHGFSLIFIDTYQKATPGLTSFDDEKQAVILHRLANLTRKLGVTIVVLDHVRKRQNGTKRGELSLDDIKGTGAKPQNADCIVLVERTPDRKQVKLQSFSKDSDMNVRILLDVSPKGSPEPKFKYAGDLEQMGARSHGKTEARRKSILESMAPGEWFSIAEIAALCSVDESGMKTLQRDLNAMAGTELDSAGKNKLRRYSRRAESIGQNA